ncbi:Uncharacterised protein [Halioglobus japonicus]|nr:Uncharacterised protein [Halioglobus japonicus]
MENLVYKKVASALWVILIILIVTLASYVSVGRLLAANLSNFRTEILQELNARLPFGVEAQQVSSEWQSFTPSLILTGLRISIPGSHSPPLELSSGRMDVDVLNSLRTRSLQMTRLVLDGLSLRGELSREGKFKLAGFGSEPVGTAAPLREFLLNVERVSLRNNRLLLTMPDGEVRDLALELELSREGSQRHVQGTLASSAGARIAIVAQGMGDPFRPDLFSGQVYLDMQSAHLGAVREMFTERSITAWADGTVDLELWLNWDKGRPSLQARLEGGDLLVSADSGSWQMPLQRLALEAQLLQHNDQWSLFVSNLQIENDGAEWTLPRLQVDMEGSALQVRSSGFSLTPINTILSNQHVVSEALREAFTAMQPRGDVSALQIKVDDINQPREDWQLTANFEDLAVDSLRGAPGVTAAAGFVELSATGGFVILDSQSMSLNFPAIYREPLHFDDLYGTLHLDWNAEAMVLSSGLLTTLGEEGVAKVLFGLYIPLMEDEIGIEMELLVGLHDTHPVHRIKYIPYTLDPALLNWLSDSIGEGDIEQGAFLWRGSLRPGAAALRTVQLAFNVANTALNYHPLWPPVLVEEGVVLIDDSDVSVWAEQASLYNSQVDQLSVETRISDAGDLTLDLQGSLHGPVSDGFKVLEGSPLAQVVGPTFAAWTATGQLDTELQLHMNLSEKTAKPQVEVATLWRDVELMVMPGKLPLESLNGEFEYSTATGFSGTELAATLWGNAVTATLRQQHGGTSGAYDPATTIVDIELDTRVALADVRRWLQLDTLAFASGQTAADLVIRLAPGTSPVLTVTSDLQGVSLDLPQPWQKSTQEQRRFRLETPLAQGITPLALDVGEDLHLRLAMDAGIVRAGALGINQQAPDVSDGVLRVAGHTPLLQIDEWLLLLDQYFGDLDALWKGGGAASEQITKADSVAEVTPGQKTQQGGAAAASFKVEVDQLRADSVIVAGQDLHDLVFDLALDPEQWQLNLATDWLRGELSSNPEDAPLSLAVEYLDIDGLPDFKLAENDGNARWELPRLNVSLNNIFQSEQRFGELGFELISEADVITLDQLTGELAGLRLSAGQPGQLTWHQGAEAYTEVRAALNFEDLGDTLAYFDYERIVETRDGDIKVAFRWPGSPQAFVLADSEGTLQLQIGSGSFLDAPAGASGAVRVASILNLADVVRRLSLSNTFDAGIPFDSVQGEIKVQNGILTVARMDVEGSSSFRFSGVSDLHSRTLDGQLVATLPVANNLPWIAALAASLPVAAGVFVVSQVFSEQMNRLSSAVYKIGGSWDEPEVSFDRIFDSASKSPANTSADGPSADALSPVQSVSP